MNLYTHTIMAGQIIKRGERTWLVRVFIGRDANGKRRYHSQTVHGTKKQADSVLRDVLIQRDSGHIRGQSKLTVDAYLDEWLKGLNVRTRTREDYAYTLKTYVRPHLGALYVDAVAQHDVLKMFSALRAQGLAARTIGKAHEVIRNAFEHAVAVGLIVVNPARGRVIAKALPRAEHVERQTVPMASVKQFIAMAKDHRLGALWVFQLFSGFRPEEALALRWSDLSDDTVRVQRVFVDKPGKPLYIEAPKSAKSARAVVMPKLVMDTLKEHKRRQAAERLKAGQAWRGEAWVFCDEVGQPLRQDPTRRRFKKFLRDAGLPPMRPYDLRHSAATLLLELGEDLKVVSERLGHSTITLTADTYSHVTRGMQERAADKLDKLVAVG